jgi:hypothetical protein
MKQKLLFLGLFVAALAFNTAFAQTSNYTQAQPFQNYVNYGDTITITFTSAPGSPLSAQLEVFYEGDFGDGSEYINIYDENWNFIGKTNSSPTGDCSYDSTIINFSNLSALNAATADGNVIFYAIPTLDVDFFCTESRIKATLSYSYCTTPFTQYPTLTLNANTNSFCPSDRNVSFTAVPTGGNYTTSAGTMNGNNFYIGNLSSGSYTVTYSSTQNGCTASDSKTIQVLNSFITNVLDTTMCANNNGIQLSISNTDPYSLPVWYDNNNFITPIATNVKSLNIPSISQNTTYYIRDEDQTKFKIESLVNANHVVIDHDNLSGDDRGGIAVTANHIYYVGDDNTVRYDLDLTPTSGISLPIRDGIFSDLSNGNLYTFHDGTTELQRNNVGSFIISEIRAMDADLNIASSATITLNTPITLGEYYNNIVYSGRGFVGLYNYNDYRFYVINLINGQVSDLGQATESDFMYGAENWAEWGILEFDGTDFYGLQRGINWNGFDNYNDLVRFKFPNTSSVNSVVHSFNQLDDTYNFTYWPVNNRLYVHVEYSSSDFGGGSENLAYISGTFSNGVPCVATVNVTIDACAGVEENEAFNFNVYPNPAREALTIEVSENSKLEVYAYDGKLVAQENISNRTVLNVSKFNNGIYFVRLTNEAGETYQTKFVKN